MINLNDNVFNEYIETLQEVLRLPTVFEAATVSEHAPYGQRVHQGYLWFKQKAKEWGFDLIEVSGHALAMVYGNQKTRVESVSHMDVVSVGDGWSVDPFGAQIVNQALYGRGTQDMKAALVANMIALKYIKESDMQLKHQVRVVCGMDEERTMEDIRLYVEQEHEPLFAFTPDGAFPISGGEKGAVMWILQGQLDIPSIIWMDGGSACNVICDEFTVLLKEVSIEKTKKIIEALKVKATITSREDGVLLVVKGVAAHSSRPELGHNAIVDGLNILRYLLKDPTIKALYRLYHDSYGSGFDGAFEHALMGPLTSGLNVLRYHGEAFYAEVDCRFPLGVSIHDLNEVMKEQLPTLEVILDYHERALLTDMQSPFVKTCVDIYQKMTGDVKSEAYISGGVTYAKKYQGTCVPYGIRFPYSPTPTLAHQIDEHILLEELKMALDITVNALVELANVEVTHG